MTIKRILLFLCLFFSYNAVFALDLTLYFTNVSSIDESNVDELKVVYRCHKTTGGLLGLFKNTAENESKACAGWEQKAWYKAKDYCEKKSLELHEVSRTSASSPFSNGICSKGDCNTNLAIGDVLDTEIRFRCSSDSILNRSHEETQNKIGEEHAALQKKYSQGQLEADKKSIRLLCNAQTREIFEISIEFSELFNTSNLTRVEMTYDQQNLTIKSHNLKPFQFHNTSTKYLKFNRDILTSSFSADNLIIFDDKNNQVKTQCFYQ